MDGMDVAKDARPDAPVRFAALDSCRGICALLVASFHFTTVSHVFFLRFTQNSWIFVDFFFALSGFVISHSYQDRLRDRAELASFALRRFGRVWPLHALMLVPVLLLELAKLYLMGHGYTAERAPFVGVNSLPLLVSNIALLQCIPPFGPPGWNGPSWSISVEYWTYIGFALLVLALSSRAGLDRRRSLLPFLLVMVAASAALIFWPGTMSAIYPFGIARCLCSFAAGHLACRWWKHAQVGGPAAASAVELGLVVAVIGFVSMGAETPLQFAAPLLFGGAIAVFAGERGLVSRLLRTRPFLFLGELSFSIYMTHENLRELFRRAVAIWEQHSGQRLSVMRPLDGEMHNITDIGGAWGGDLLLIAFLGIVVLVSVVTLRLVERPGQALFRRLATRMLSRRERAQAPLAEPYPL
jgi:peptidoglycan/LPS O-acetylase OafA/YrhL